MLPAGLEELLKADPLDRGIIVDVQPLSWVVISGAAHRHLGDILRQDHRVLDLSHDRFLAMIDGLLARFGDTALGLLHLRLQLLGQLLDLMGEDGLQH